MTIGREQIEASLALLDGANNDDLGSLRAMREELRNVLGGIGTETVESALAGVIDSLPSLARELDKAEPLVRIDDGGYRLRSEAAGTVSDVFTHLLRNSLDHGIETPAQRREQGKAEAGLIDIKLDMSEGALRIALADDGRGLALARIRGIAAQRGWLGAGESISDDAVAAFIFRAGFSTAHSVTEVSGRGVGMDAVRDFLEREGGRIELRFTDNSEGADYRHFETIVYLPQHCAVAATAARASAQEEALA
jgi:sensor histidine kinase regulating citrate/malate metabolism